MMKKILIGLVVALCLFAVGYNAYQSEKRAHSDKKNIYALLPLTGFGSHVGKQQRAAIELWREKNPDPSFNLHIIDSETAPMKAITALKQALLNEENPIVITSNSLISYNSIPTIEEKKGFQFMICTFDKEGFHNSHFLRMCDRSVDSISHIAKYLSRYKNLFAFYTNEEFGKSSFNSLKKLLPENNDISIPNIAIEPAQRDIRIEVLKALEKKPEAIIILGFTSLATINLVKELRRQGYDKDIVMGSGLADPSIYTQLDGYLDNLIFPDKNMQLTEGPNVPTLKKIEQAIHGRPFYIPLEIWDTLDLIDWTIKNNKPFTQETYAKLGKWKGLAGDIEFLDDGNVIYQFHLATFKDGKIVPLKE